MRARKSLQAAMADRQSFIDLQATNAFRVIHGAGDGWPGWYIDRFGDYLLSQSKSALTQQQVRHLEALMAGEGLKGVYQKNLDRHVRYKAPSHSAPKLLAGEPCADAAEIQENGLGYLIRFDRTYSVGLFLDQRENRRKIATNSLAAGGSMLKGGLKGRQVLNVFAYTCAFSVCAAKAGARVTSLDLSRGYLDWGKENFMLNAIRPDEHSFVYGDAFDWLKRFAKKRRRFDLIILDPPTFSKSKKERSFEVQKDIGNLIIACMPILASGGTLLASSNKTSWRASAFVKAVRTAVERGGRAISLSQLEAQPRDFPSTAEEPPYLKSLWLRVRN